MKTITREFLHYTEPQNIFTEVKKKMVNFADAREKKKSAQSMKKALIAAQKEARKYKEAQRNEQTNQFFANPLSFDELNPVLAKQLTEVETQLGQLAMIQSEMAEERRRMNAEMLAIKQLILVPNSR